MAITIVCVLVFLMLGALSGFFLKEFLIKGSCVRQFELDTRSRVQWDWPGAKECGVKPSMWHVVLSSDRPFGVLIGFDLHLPGRVLYDYYGYGRSNGAHRLVISLFAGNNPARFVFLSTRDIDQYPISIDAYPAKEDEVPDQVYPPHPWQHFRIFWHFLLKRV